MLTDASSPVRPLLKWAGGKRQLMPYLRPHFPHSFRRYIEPFFGSGAVFFDLYGRGDLVGRTATLADVNPDLIGCYRTLVSQTDAVIRALGRLAREHAADPEGCYYDVRDQRFNPARAAGQPYTPALAAMLIYLNRTGFNGLFRVNRDGAFNVPAGRYANPRICDEGVLRGVAKALGDGTVDLRLGSFDTALAGAGRGDFIYCDPPYAPLSRTACFAHYTAGGFSSNDQERLLDALIAAANRGATIVLSNSSAPEMVALYSRPAARKAGLRLERVPARRAISSNGSGRGPVDELVVTNAAPKTRLRMARATEKPVSVRRRA